MKVQYLAEISMNAVKKGQPLFSLKEFRDSLSLTATCDLCHCSLYPSAFIDAARDHAFIKCPYCGTVFVDLDK